MNQSLPTHAFFLPAPSAENSGVDFLGLRQANLDMMGDLIPATNNVTGYVRPFSLLCWIYWKFHELCERTGRSAPSSEDVRVFRERVEVLFTWGARIADAPGIPGKQASPPAGGKAVPLTFTEWKRVQTSTSLIAALWYGPASKTVTGLGFLEPVAPEFFRTVGHGITLAEALDNVLRSEPDLYGRLLDTLNFVEADEEDAASLWSLWGVATLTAAERQAFQQALYDSDAVGEYRTPLGQRSSTIALAMLHLSHCDTAASDEDIREGMYFSMSAEGVPYEVPAALDRAQRKWIILQVRQLQRYALETMLAWCEHMIIYERVHDTAALTESALARLADASFTLHLDEGIGRLIEGLDQEFSSMEDFVGRGRVDATFNPFAVMRNIRDAAAADDTSVIAQCLYGLFLCTAFAGCFADKTNIAAGGPARLSLYDLRRRLVALEDATLKQTIQFIIEALVISQHFATAVNRFDGQNQRLRLSIEEDGLIALVDKPWRPAITEDRLPTILSLAAECGLICRDGAEGYILAQGNT